MQPGKSRSGAAASPDILSTIVGYGWITEFDSNASPFLGHNRAQCLCASMWVGVFSEWRSPYRRPLQCTVPRMAVQVPAHITGTVWKIEVKVGDTVASEQTLVILESMKMEMPVEAPQAGRVSQILVAEGQAVEEGDALVELD